jgi:xanthine dehydrogenase YagR molybdenum-binding subunit
MSVGQPIERVDGRLKVTGRATYTADQNIPGLVFGVLVTSAIAKGRIASIDTRAAERVPGTLTVLTHKSGLKLAKDPTQVDLGYPPIARSNCCKMTGSSMATSR